MSYVSLVLRIAFLFRMFSFLAFFMLCNFLLKVGHAVPVSKYLGKQTLLCGLMLTCIKIGLCLILLLSINIKGFRFLCVCFLILSFVFLLDFQFSLVQSLSRVRLFANP